MVKKIPLLWPSEPFYQNLEKLEERSHPRSKISTIELVESIYSQELADNNMALYAQLRKRKIVKRTIFLKTLSQHPPCLFLQIKRWFNT